MSEFLAIRVSGIFLCYGNLFTRPRRFGKSLNMSMLRAFFEIGTDKSIFDGLSISRETELCEKYMGKYPVIFLSLKDVAGLNYAEENGYYNEMAQFISRFFSYGMKSNENLLFSVVTGCLRVVKESIFTGFNNPKVHTIVDDQYDEWFGFTNDEVREMLHYYNLDRYYDITKEWYDGYRFGSVNVYCPWDVINWCEQLRRSTDHTPQNLWSILFTTGYLTHCGRNADGSWQLKIPNREVNDLFDRQIRNWFYKRVEGK